VRFFLDEGDEPHPAGSNSALSSSKMVDTSDACGQLFCVAREAGDISGMFEAVKTRGEDIRYWALIALVAASSGFLWSVRGSAHREIAPEDSGERWVVDSCRAEVGPWDCLLRLSGHLRPEPPLSRMARPEPRDDRYMKIIHATIPAAAMIADCPMSRKAECGITMTSLAYEADEVRDALDRLQ
jgi:hypothetical protein